MKKSKTRKITDGMKIIERRFLSKDSELRKMVDEEFEKLKLAAELQALAAMPEDDIDTSGVPEKIDWSNAEVGKGGRKPSRRRT